MKQTKREYIIRTVDDFLSVPKEKMPECLSDFAQFLSAARQADKMNVELSSVLGIKDSVRIDTNTFHWVDDGRDGCTAVELNTTDGKNIGRIEF